MFMHVYSLLESTIPFRSLHHKTPRILSYTNSFTRWVDHVDLLDCLCMFHHTQQGSDSHRAKLHYTDTGYEHQLRTPPTNTTNGQKFATSQHLDMSRCCPGSGIAMWQICCRIIVSLSVGGVLSVLRSRCL